MGDQINVLPILVIGALAELPVQLPYVLLADSRGLQDGSGDQLELLGPALAVIGPQPEPSLMVALQHQHVLAVHDGQQELHHLSVLHAPVYVIPHKNIHFIVFQPAVVRQVLLQNRIAAVDVPDVMYLPVGGHVEQPGPHAVQLVRPDYLNAGGNLLGPEPGIHIVNHRLRHLLERLPGRVPALHLLYGNAGKVHAVDAVPIGLAHFLVPVHLAGLGIGGVYHREIPSLHPDLQNAEQGLPDDAVIGLADACGAVREHHRALAQ